MAYTSYDFASKKALKDAIKKGLKSTAFQPGPFGPDLTNFTGNVCLEGPHYPKPHSWWATAKMVDGVIVKVT